MIKRASVADVAKLAGVSTATVSRVTTHPDRVSKETRDKVLVAIDELNFVKSASGLSLRHQRSSNVLVVVNNIGNVYWSEIFQGIHHRAEASGYSVMITTPNVEIAGSNYLDRLRTGRVDGVIVLEELQILDGKYDELIKEFQGVPPIVCFSERRDSTRLPHVLIDNREAAYRATKFLIESGHTHIAHIRGPENLQVSIERMAGFMEAMTENGLSVGPDDIWPTEFHRDGGRRAARRIARLPNMPSAIFCCTDEVALGCIAEFATLGISIPEDVSVMGFDNNAFADIAVPALTTMAQSREQIGVAAMDLLLKYLDGEDRPAFDAKRKPEVVELKVHLAKRASVQSIKRGRT